MVDFSKYVGQSTPLQQYDFGSGFRALAQQRLQEARLAEDARQANQQEAGTQARHTDSMNYNRESLDSTNDRYAVGLADEQRTKEYESKINAKKQQDSLLKTFNDYVARGDYSRADMMLGQLQSAGFKVDRQPGQNGNPIYRAEPPAFDGSVGNLDASNIRSQIGSQHAQQTIIPENTPSVAQPKQQSTVFEQKNPFESLPGSAAEQVPAATDSPFQAPPQPQANAIFRPTPAQSEEPASPVPDGSTPGIEQETKNPFDPYQMDTSRIRQQNQARLDPVLRGLVGATPGRYQPNMGAYVSGVREMGLPLEESLESMQKPMDTVAGLWKGEMGAENARARINVSMGGQDANRNIRLEDRMWRRMDGIGKSFDLTGRKLKLDKVNETISHLSKNNPSADGLMVSTIRNMFESGVMTDRDFQNTKEGIKGILQQIRDGVDEKLIGTGLNPDSRAGLTAFLRDITRDDTAAVQKAQSQLLTQAQRAGSEEELKTVYDYISANVPQALWSDEVKQEFGLPVERKTGSMDKEGNYATNKAPKTGAPKQSASIDVNSEVESLLDGY